MLTALAHVETGACWLPWCDWAGMHWHWGGRRFRSIAELAPEERIAFDADCRLTNGLRAAGLELADGLTRELELTGITNPEPAGRRQTERSTMPDRSEINRLARSDYAGEANGPTMSMGATALAMSEQESNDRERLSGAGQWIGLLDAADEHIAERVAGRPLGSTIDDLEQIERSAEDLEGIAYRLRLLRASMREAVGAHMVRHDERRDERNASKQKDVGR